jgi:hypothetical protein
MVLVAIEWQSSKSWAEWREKEKVGKGDKEQVFINCRRRGRSCWATTPTLPLLGILRIEKGGDLKNYGVKETFLPLEACDTSIGRGQYNSCSLGIL